MNKYFEVLDVGTCISVLCVELVSGEETPKESFLLGRVGFRGDLYILMINLSNMQVEYGSYEWKDKNSTLQTAHEFVIEHWQDLESGDVIDVEYIRG